jgi:hypothetical protein
VFWLVILAIVVLALAAAALMDARNKRLGITIDPEAIRQRRKEQSREVRRSLLTRGRRLGSSDDERGG